MVDAKFMKESSTVVHSKPAAQFDEADDGTGQQSDLLPAVSADAGIKRVPVMPDGYGSRAGGGYEGGLRSLVNENAVKKNEKQVVITKLRSQNEKLKTELKMLTGKLESFIEK